MHALTGEREELRCSKCGSVIALFSPHVRLRMVMLSGKTSTQRYCENCCLDPALAVLFSDVITQPVKKMVIDRVWT